MSEKDKELAEILAQKHTTKRASVDSLEDILCSFVG